MKKKALLSSILTIALCLSLIAGSTFALFTSTDTVNVAVTSGTVDVVATVENLTLGTTLAKGNLSETSATQDAEDSNIITLDKIVPGDYVTFDIRIHNNSDVAVQYRTVITKVADEGLWDGLVVTFDDVEYEGTNAVKTEWTSMAVGCADIIVSVKVALPENAGNEYQHTSCKFACTVEAVQGNAEVTQEWDGVTKTAVAKAADGKYHINTAAELMWVMNESQSGGSSRFYNEYFVLENNIDLGGATITGFGNEGCIFGGSFDGENHSISNFVIERSDIEDFAGLFNYYCYGTLENLTVKNASVNGVCKVGALVGGVYDNATVKNCSVVDCVVVANRKAAGAIGYGQYATIENVSVKDTTLYVENTDAEQYGKVVGYENTGLNITGSSDKNVTIIFMARVNTLDAFTAAVNNAQISKIVLTGDITNETVPLNAGQNAYTYTLQARELTIDLNGHTFNTPVRMFMLGDNYGKTTATLTIMSSKQGGKINMNKTGGSEAYGFVVQQNCTLNIKENVTIEMNLPTRASYQTLILNNGTVNMDGGKLIGYNTVIIASHYTASNNGIFNMNGGEISIDASSTGIQTVGNNNPTINLTKGSITGNGVAYERMYGGVYNVGTDFVIADTCTISSKG